METQKFEGQEHIPEMKVDISWDQTNKMQKFVDFFDKEGNYYIVSLPQSEAREHRDLLNIAKEKYNLSENPPKSGGGQLMKNGNEITAFGVSFGLGEFNQEMTEKALKSTYPEPDWKVKVL